MQYIQKTALLLMMMGQDKGRRIFELLDDQEIKAVTEAIRTLPGLAAGEQAQVWQEFCNAGYDDEMTAAQTLQVIRSLFGGRRIGSVKRRLFKAGQHRT